MAKPKPKMNKGNNSDEDIRKFHGENAVGNASAPTDLEALRKLMSLGASPNRMLGK